jgi:hypothetical protein
LEHLRRGILGRHAGKVCQKLKSAPEAYCVVDPAIAARCLVGAVFETLTSWLEEDPAERPLAAKVARTVADYNLRAIRG